MWSSNITNTLILLCLITIIVFFLNAYFKMKKTLNFWKSKGVKHLEGKLFFGNMVLFDSISFVERVQKIYLNFPDEKYFGFYQFMLPTLIIKDPDLIKQITIRNFEHFVDHQDFADPDVDPVLSRTLFASRGQKWRDLRITLSPSFTGNKMKIMFGLIDECCQKFVSFFQEQSGDIIELNVKDTCSRYTNDVLISTSFGVQCNSFRDPNNEFYTIGKKITDFSGIRMFKVLLYMISPALGRFLGLRIFPARIIKRFSEMIKETIEIREKNKIVRPDMLYLLTEAMKGNLAHDEELQQDENFSTLIKTARKYDITIDDIISQAIVFFLGGFETVATFLMYFFYELAVNPEVQNKLRQEILEIDQEVEGQITYSKLLSMKYLDMVVSETLRLWPVAFLVSRKVTKPVTLESPGMKPLNLETGTIVWLPAYGLHRDPKFFPDPERFDPERFNDQNRHKINGGVYIPFGLGPRSCIGNRFALLESKLLIYHVLKNFELVPVQKTAIPLILDPANMNLNPKGGMWLGLKKIAPIKPQ